MLFQPIETITVKPRKNGKTIISVENRKFSRSWMTKWTLPLNSSREILLSRRISLDFETVGISRFSGHQVSGET